MTGTLYIVSTPIGNLEDMTLRALRILKEATAVVSEDTRRTLPLLTHFGIQKKIISYFEYSKESKTDYLIRLLHDGSSLALVTDAGTPSISDPGARLVARARSEGIPVIPVPGPVAFAVALSVSGMPTDPFHFWGFLPQSRGKRKKIYDLMLTLEGTHGLYESPHKIVKRMEEWGESFSSYYFFIGREMTKKFESYYSGSYQEVLEQLKTAKIAGEFTVLFSSRLMKKEVVSSSLDDPDWQDRE